MAGATKFERTQSINSMAREEDREKLLNKIANELEMNENDEEQIRIKEQGILELGLLYKQQGKAKDLADLIAKSRPFLNLISKAKAAKLVRSLVDFFLDLEAGTGIEVQLCKDCIEWAKQEKRTFLRQSLEARLIALYFDTGLFSEALSLGSQLLKELKKMDDKNLLVEVQLLESKTYHALSNLSKVMTSILIPLCSSMTHQIFLIRLALHSLQLELPLIQSTVHQKSKHLSIYSPESSMQLMNVILKPHSRTFMKLSKDMTVWKMSRHLRLLNTCCYAKLCSVFRMTLIRLSVANW